MTDSNRVYTLTSVRGPDVVDVAGLNPNFFETFETVTTIRDPQQIQFKVEKHLRRTPNQAEITLVNLAVAARDDFVKGKQRVTLAAGYDGAPSLLFLGDLRYASNEHEGTEWITKLQLADAGRAYAAARMNKTYAKGTPLSTIVGDIARSFGVPLPASVATSPDLKTRISTGEALTGYSADELARILAPYGLEYSFQNGRLQVIKVDAVVPGSVRVLSQDSGMLGAPTIDAPKIIAPPKTVRHRAGTLPRVPKLKIKHKLYPEVLPGEQIRIESRSVNGTFRVENVVHQGDWFGDEWTTEIEAVAV